MIPIMTYTFDTFLATKYGVNEAILLNNFIFWIAKNEANRIHFHDGVHRGKVCCFVVVKPCIRHGFCHGLLYKVFFQSCRIP